MAERPRLRLHPALLNKGRRLLQEGDPEAYRLLEVTGATGDVTDADVVAYWMRKVLDMVEPSPASACSDVLVPPADVA